MAINGLMLRYHHMSIVLCWFFLLLFPEEYWKYINWKFGQFSVLLLSLKNFNIYQFNEKVYIVLYLAYIAVAVAVCLALVYHIIIISVWVHGHGPYDYWWEKPNICKRDKILHQPTIYHHICVSASTFIFRCKPIWLLMGKALVSVNETKILPLVTISSSYLCKTVLVHCAREFIFTFFYPPLLIFSVTILVHFILKIYIFWKYI